MAITTEQVKQLRDMTGISVMHCKKALEEAGGDMDKALELLRKQGKAAADKKADRTLGAGTVAAYIHSSKDVGALVMLMCETDFVSKNEEFMALAYDLALQVAATNPQYVSVSEIPEDAQAKAREMFLPDLAGKPENLHEEILAGKLAAYWKPQVLLAQEFIKDPERSIKDLIDAATQKFGERVEIGKISRFSARG